MRSLRIVPLGIAIALALSMLPSVVDAEPLPPGGGRTFVVDCALGGKISSRLTGDRTQITVKNTCVENLVIPYNDISIVTDGVTPAAIVAANPNQPAVLLEGARRVVIDGRAAGLTVSGGTAGISVTRGAAVDVRNCAVTNTTTNGLVATYGGSLIVDNCTITDNSGNGVTAANGASLNITNSTVSSNDLIGIVAVRTSFIRIGQDAAGTLAVKPVTVSGNGTNGVVISEGSSGIVVGGTIQTSGSTNVFIGRASSGQIGVGSNGLTGAVTIQNGSSHGVHIEGGNATIVFSTISGHHLTGIILTNAGSARIGILNASTGYGPNTITGNGGPGIHLATGAAAFIGGTTVSGNGTIGASVFGRFGINVSKSSVNLAGNNVIQNNAETGIFVSAGHLLIGDAGFGLPTTNTITGNGGTGPNNGGLFAFEGATIRVNDATISNNVGPALQAFEGGIIELRGNTSVTVPAAGVTPGALVQFGSTLRVRDNASIVSATTDGIQASNLTAVNVRDSTSIVQGNGADSFGVRCFALASDVPSAATLTGNLAGVTGSAGQQAGCNSFP